MFRRHPQLTGFALLVAGLLSGCSDRLVEPLARSSSPALAIVDGARAGNPAFFFLPPMVPAPSYSGTFDGTQSPEVRVCALVGGACGTTIVVLSGTDVKVDPVAEAYHANWQTRSEGAEVPERSRIEVRVNGQLLGFADVKLVTGGGIRLEENGQIIAIQRGRTLPIRFRIETGAVTPPPPPPPPSGGWSDGDVLTFGQSVWGDGGTPTGGILDVQFGPVFFGAGGAVSVGLSAPMHSLRFTDPATIAAFLPASGPDGPLTASATDPTTSSAGAFGGEVLSLALNVAFADAQVSGVVWTPDGQRLRIARFGTASDRLGDLTLCGLASPSGLDGQSVRQILALANTLLGGGSGPLTIAQLSPVVASLNAAFADGAPGSFAQQYLRLPGCQQKSWQADEVFTLTQARWGSAPVRDVLGTSFGPVYFNTSGVRLGTPGLGFIMLLTSPSSVVNYLPAVGLPGALTANVTDPSATTAGQFGGELTALKLNVDLGDAGFLSGNANVRFGDLTLCSLAGAQSGINGTSVRGVLAMGESALGGNTTPLTIMDLNSLAVNLNHAFASGIVSQFARAHLVAGACSPPPPPPPPPPTTWTNGDLVTFPQTPWGGPEDPSWGMLGANFNAVFAAQFGVLEVGIPGAAGHSIALTGSGVMRYLPAAGAAGPLTADLFDPSASVAGVFGGEVVALALNVAFADAGVSGAVWTPNDQAITFAKFGTAATKFGDLVLCNLASPAGINGQTVRQVLTHANTLLGGGATSWTIAELNALTASLNAAFADGVPSSFATAHLGLAGCQPTSWGAGDVYTLTQARWGTGFAAELLLKWYDAVYSAAFNVFEVGVPGAAGFSIAFTQAQFVITYLPATGPAAPLNNDTSNPTSTVSGVFGGEVAALALNVDFADAGHLVGRSASRFGDLTLCGFTGALAGINGTTVRGALAVANTALGGGTVPYALADVNVLARDLNFSFAGGVASPFAHGHLVHGACP